MKEEYVIALMAAMFRAAHIINQPRDTGKDLVDTDRQYVDRARSLLMAVEEESYSVERTSKESRTPSPMDYRREALMGCTALPIAGFFGNAQLYDPLKIFWAVRTSVGKIMYDDRFPIGKSPMGHAAPDDATHVVIFR